MKKWADYLISEVSYDSENLISIATRHQETDQGISAGKPIDRLTIASNIKNGLSYITIYSGKNSWKKGNIIQTFSIEGSPYIRIDKNKVKLDYLGDLSESLFLKSKPIQELDLTPTIEPEPPSSPRGSLPKESAEELSQELDLTPTIEPEPPSSPRGSLPKESAEELSQELDLTPTIEPEEEATSEQLAQLDDLQQQIDELENTLSNQFLPESKLEEEATPKQFSKIKKLEKEIAKLEATDIEHKIIKTLQKQNKKLGNIEKHLTNSEKNEINNLESILPDAYCVKCKTKRTIKNPEETTMKNGRPAIRGICSVCKSKVFRIVKMKK